jgi:hypothetical protein
VTQRPNDLDIQEENKKLRRLQFLVGMVTSVISQGNMPVEEASELVDSTRRAALAMFPGKEMAWDLLYRPRLQRLMVEKYRIM